MRQALALNSRTENQEQVIDIKIVFTDFTTTPVPEAQRSGIGQPHGDIRFVASLLLNGNVSIEMTIRREDGTLAYNQRFAYRPDEMIKNSRSRQRCR